MNLYPHQKTALEETKNFNKCAYYLDMGLGKTFVGAEKMHQLDKRNNLIVCQKSKIADWIEHIKKFYNHQVYDLSKPKQLDEFMGKSLSKKYHITGIINYDLVWRRKDLLQLDNYTLMLDESSVIQNPKTKRTKFILKLKPTNVILLSGTPTSGKYENLWSQLNLLGWGISIDLYYKQYVNWKKIDAGGVPIKVVDKDDPYKNVDRLKSKMREHGAVFMKTEECFDLPQQMFQTIKVAASKEYHKFRKTCIVQIQTDDVKHELVGDTTLTQLLYSRQLCGQFSANKLQAFKDLCESTKDRLIVFYNFNDELAALKKIAADLERPVSEVNGHTKDLTAYDEFSDSITLVQYQAGAMGLNLQKSNKIVFFTLPLMSELYEQAKKRIHRIGQNKPCFYYLLIVQDTIEELILKTLKERKNLTDELFREYEKNHWNIGCDVDGGYGDGIF